MVADVSNGHSPKTGKPASAAGLPYAIMWTLIVAARTARSCGVTHWFPVQLGQWCVAYLVTGAASPFLSGVKDKSRSIGLAGCRR